MRKINQSYSFCEHQIKWIKDNFSSNKRISEMNESAMEEEFFELFGVKRSFRALYARAKREGVRPAKKELKVGISRIAGKKGGPEYILYQLNPPKYMSLPRYLYEKHHGVKLDRNDVIIHLDGDALNCDISNLKLISRSELLMMNNISATAPVETRSLIAELEIKTQNIKGRGDWSEDEIEWIKDVNLPKKIKKGFWLALASRFNAVFNKNRSNRDILMKYYALKKVGDQ